MDSIQKLWTFIAKFFEFLVCSKFGFFKEQSTLMALGCNDINNFLKRIQLIVYNCFNKTQFSDSGILPTGFLACYIEILKYIINVSEEMSVLQMIDYNVIVKNKEFFHFSHQLEEDFQFLQVETLCQDLIKIIFLAPEFSEKIGNILLKTCNHYGNLYDVIETLTKLIRISSLSIFGEDFLDCFQQTDNIRIDTNIQKFSGLLNTFYIILDNTQALKIANQYEFYEFAVKTLKKSVTSKLSGDWAGYLFKILNLLVNFAEQDYEELHPIVSKLLLTKAVFNPIEAKGFFSLLTTLTQNPSFSKKFLESNSLICLLSMKTTEIIKNDLKIDSEKILKNLCESPFVLQNSYEENFSKFLKKNFVSLEKFVFFFKKEAARNKEIFLKAFMNTCSLVEKEKPYVEKKITKQEILAEK